jgi:hypothetical protein
MLGSVGLASQPDRKTPPDGREKRTPLERFQPLLEPQRADQKRLEPRTGFLASAAFRRRLKPAPGKAVRRK